MSELLESRWQDTKTALLEGLQGNKKGVMATTLENTRKYLSETAVAGTTSAGNVATLNRVILPVIRRVMPTVIANELVGVQPMTGPVGQIHTLRVRYSDTVGSGASGASAGEEALSPFKIAEAYSGNASTGKADNTAVLEGAAGQEDDDQAKTKGRRKQIVRHVFVRRCLHLEEQEGRREERAENELQHRILQEHHQPNQHEATEHLDELPPEEVRLKLAM